LGGMGDITDIGCAHVTGNAGVILGTAQGLVRRTRLLLVAIEAADPVKRIGLLRIRFSVWIVAGNAAQLSFTCLETSAVIHLLNVAGKLGPALVIVARATDQYGPGLAEFLAGSKIQEGLAVTWLTPATGKMALVTDTFPPAGFEFSGIDDQLAFPLAAVELHFNMVPAWTMAAFTADAQLVKWSVELVLIFTIGKAVDSSGMTGKAVIVNTSFKSQVVGRAVAGCQVPDSLLDVPGKG